VISTYTIYRNLAHFFLGSVLLSEICKKYVICSIARRVLDWDVLVSGGGARVSEGESI